VIIAAALLMATIQIPYRLEPRHYQVPLLAAMDQGCKRAVQVWHRRAGKEKTDLAAVMVPKMLERVGSYFYVFPEALQGRKIIWDGADKDGFRFIDHIPKEIMYGEPNNTEMKVRLKKPGTTEPGSLLQVVGSDRYNAVMGTNPVGLVLSEYSLQDPTCWSYFRPILAENGGWALFNYTPRGENHAYDIYELAKADPFHPVTNPRGWFASLLTVDDTGAVAPEVLEAERRETIRLHGNDAMYLQEYYCSFAAPIAGAYYAEQLSKALRDGRVGHVPHEDRLTVDTWWDLGMNDRMAIWFTQSVGQELRVIDYMEGSGQGLPFYIGKLKEKPYIYGRHTAPHDISVRELGTGKSRLEAARALGVEFEIAPKLPPLDGIDAARSLFARCYFDKEKTKDGVNALKNYRKQYDEKRKTYLSMPYHDWASNGADAFRYLAVSLAATHKSEEARTPEGKAVDKYERCRRQGSGGGDNPVGCLG
jgi:phage terminase large subunit